MARKSKPCTHTGKRYCLVNDESGHWYVCPAERAEEADDIFCSGDGDEVPNWLHQVNGHPNNVTFSAPEIFGKPVNQKAKD